MKSAIHVTRLHVLNSGLIWEGNAPNTALYLISLLDSEQFACLCLGKSAPGSPKCLVHTA